LPLPGPTAAESARPAWDKSAMTVAAFLAHLRAGGLIAGPRAELVAGAVQPPARLSPRDTATLLRLEQSLRSAMAGHGGQAVMTAAVEGSRSAPFHLRLERFAALRLGPGDLLRGDLVVLFDTTYTATRPSPVDPAAARPSATGPSAMGPSRPRPPTVPSGANLGGSHDPRAAAFVVEAVRGRSSREQRLPLYAAAGVRELWLLDVGRGWTEVFRSPWRGLYRSRTLWYPGEPMPLQ